MTSCDLRLYLHLPPSLCQAITFNDTLKRHWSRYNERTDRHLKSTGAGCLPKVPVRSYVLTAELTAYSCSIFRSSILLKLVLFSIALGVAPLSSYFLSKDYVWSGAYPFQHLCSGIAAFLPQLITSSCRKFHIRSHYCHCSSK